MNNREKVKDLEKDNNRGGMHQFHMQSNAMFAIAYAILDVAEAIRELDNKLPPREIRRKLR
jgi:hypothetical protein